MKIALKRRMKTFFGLLFVIFQAQSATAWELSDVSVLMPLPKVLSDASALLKTGDSGALGALVPAEIVSQLPKLVFNRERATTYNEELRALSIRFDPCFTEGADPQPCRKQVRIAWQPMVAKGVQVLTIDAALHTFYEFDDAGFAKLMREYQALLTANPHPPLSVLDVNPRLRTQGLKGPFAKGFKALLLAHCGAQNLVRATVMTLEEGNNDWKFMGWNIRGTVLTPISIAVVQAPLQELKTVLPVGFDLKAQVQPQGYSPVASQIYKDSLLARKSLSEREFSDFASAVLTIENPNRSNPGTVDCAACHMSGPGAQWLRLNFPAWNWASLVAQSGFSTKRDVRNVTLPSLKPRRFRAFGYFVSDPLISQRTINESALVADKLDQMFPQGAQP